MVVMAIGQTTPKNPLLPASSIATSIDNTPLVPGGNAGAFACFAYSILSL